MLKIISNLFKIIDTEPSSSFSVCFSDNKKQVLEEIEYAEKALSILKKAINGDETVEIRESGTAWRDISEYNLHDYEDALKYLTGRGWKEDGGFIINEKIKALGGRSLKIHKDGYSCTALIDISIAIDERLMNLDDKTALNTWIKGNRKND